MNSMVSFYSQRIEDEKLKLVRIKKRLNLLVVCRLLAFIFLIIVPIKLYPVSHLTGVFFLIILLILFLALIRLSIKAKREKRIIENLIKINSDELLSLEHKFSQFDEGKEFIDPNHFNSYDLDIFGAGSLFQFLNRTFTLSGKSKLAQMLLYPSLKIEDIEASQDSVKELALKVDWRQSYSAKGQLYIDNNIYTKLLNIWGKEDYSLKLQKIIRPLLFILPVFSFLTLLIWIFIGNASLFLFSGIIQSVLWISERKNTTLIYSLFGKKQEILSLYSSLIEMIENEEWQSEENKILVKEMTYKEATSKEIFKLKKITSIYDNRNNFLVGFLLNITFLWDILFSYLLIRWHNKNKENYKIWDSVVSFFDARNSIANYAFNNPEYIYPKFRDGEFELIAENLGHPLINSQRRVNNNFLINGEKKLIVITGANMAGKSTFLRTLGVNIVLGLNGAPVCATEFKLTPIVVFSNMRTTDSLYSDESYFFAELKRLKLILDEIKSGKKLLIILDEILKGTNSEDKLKGSQKLLKKLIEFKTPAIIATHDLKLTEMEKEYPENITNLCFEIDILDNEMHFDYKLKSGITKMMNATFLMKKMGIIE